MPKISRQVGTTSQIIELVALSTASSPVGLPLAGLAYNTASLTCYYKRNTAAASVAVTLATIATLGTFATGGFAVVDATNMVGLYEFHIPNAALAAGADNVTFCFRGATNLFPIFLLIELTATSNQDGVHGGMSALPSAAPGAAGGLFISGSNTGPVSVSGGMTIINSAGNGLVVESTGGNGNGLACVGNGSGSGLVAQGGATGGGIEAIGGSTSGNGILALGVGTGAAFLIAGGTSGNGLAITTQAGDGISVMPVAGNAVTLAANGTSKHGLSITGGTAGTSDGIHAAAGTGGVDIRAVNGTITGNITGNLVGTVSTLTTYTGNTPQTGDSFARLGAPSGASIDADILSRLATSGYTTPPTAAAIAAAVAAPTAAAIATAVWKDTTAGDFTTAGSIGLALFIAAAPGAAGGHLIAGANVGPVSISGGMTISNAAGNGLVVQSTGSGGNGLACLGNGGGQGLVAIGGATGNGIVAEGGSTSGSGMWLIGLGGNSAGLLCAGLGSGAGISATGGATGAGMSLMGGSTSGAALSGVVTTGAGITIPAGITANITGNLIGTVSTLTTYTGNTPQTGDSFARLGAPSGASIDADILSRLATSGYTTPPTTAAIAAAIAAGSVGSVTAGVTVTTNNDKSGYSLTQAFPANFAALGISAAGKINEVVLTDTLTTYTSNTPQTGDSYARLGAPSGASIDADILTRLAASAYTPPPGAAPTAAAIATAVWKDTTAGDFTTAGSIGLALFVAAAPGAAGGHLIAGANTGPVSISGGVAITNATGDALDLTSTATNGNGLTVTGAGSGSGIFATGPGTGNGIFAGGTSGGIVAGNGFQGNLTGNISGSVTFITGSVLGGVLGDIGGDVLGSVGSVVGGVGGSITGNLNGDVLGSVASVVNSVGQTGDSFARLGAPSGASIDADILSRLATSGYTTPPTAAAIATAVAAPSAATIAAAIAAGSVGSVTAGVQLVANGLDLVVTETGINAAQALALILDAVCAKLSGLPGGPAVIRDINDTVNRITVSFDAADNRTALVLNPPSV